MACGGWGLGAVGIGWGARVREGGVVVGWWSGGPGCKSAEQIYLGWVEFGLFGYFGYRGPILELPVLISGTVGWNPN